jgi:hypothetical protein
MSRPIILCNQHKQEREHEEGEPVEQEVERVERDVRSALQDVDPNDTKVLWERCNQILDDIHEGRL